jgi:hypothetical protein
MSSTTLFIGLIENFDSFNAMLFIAGAGYNFYDHHWVPLHRKLLDRSKWCSFIP